ncbi:NAD(P)-dependent oxidoreductase [Bergeyella sp. RCAD1439]|uniref:NAD(P)-dependent oxidoreductase n=1 Tax=Bergeyella anatis TaxID=3113737 RepID=UPI002E194AA5|nr:NAD(P)-dependent oxidoreductase [Bergeyella sp. RCAD1439]
MKFGLIKERKSPPDRRVVFSPETAGSFLEAFPQAELLVEASDLRVFGDEQYEAKGLEVTSDVSDCDVLLGVKEVPVEALIANKTYFFFSHTIKKQPYNRDLLRAVLDKNIVLYDHETLVAADGGRLVGFGRYAGIVGAYNGFRALGVRTGRFSLPKAESLSSRNDLIAELSKIELPVMKIVLTGRGKVAYGAKEMLDAMQIKEVDVEAFLGRDFSEPVYVMLDVLDYNRRKDGAMFGIEDFFEYPEAYESDFERFSRVADFFIAGHFYGSGSPVILSREMLLASENRIRVVADISCDIDGPVACTIRPSTIESPFYGYCPERHAETALDDPESITVMAVDNLPCELPKDASEGFGELFLEKVVPAFFNGDKDGILQRAKVTQHGRLTPSFAYLQDYVDGKA